MDLGMIGLGRMGANMALRLIRGGHRVVAYSPDTVHAAGFRAAAPGGKLAASLGELHDVLPRPRIGWVMVPSGDATEQVIRELSAALEPGDLIVDGGNSNYHDTMRRAAEVTAKGLEFVDVGTSGGVWGLDGGYSLTVGGTAAAVAMLRPILETLAPDPGRGWGHVGTHGAGHFVKMVHNGIEYGMMQALAEGFEILSGKGEFGLDLRRIAEIWQDGSVIRCWLLDLVARSLREDPALTGIRGWVADSGEGRWTIQEAIDQDVPAPIITLALMMRFASRQDESFAAKLLAALRHQFGGHEVQPADHTPQ
ncbi:MAG: decarboxylating 6-phosphogluconate dehydrogenase [Candidatus Eisenbacteria bacterium]|nr:decarboxylating 6-phosphogluconate dehydrogenase [Candidatus Eisenbacteria bacterium]